MKISQYLFFAVLFALGTFSCSKEKKTERMLLKKDGVWDVKEYHLLVYNADDSLILESNQTNYASFVFHKNGDFEWSSYGSAPSSPNGTWLNTDDELIVSLNANYYYGPIVLKIIEKSKSEMTLQSITRMPDIAVYKDIATYRIQRRK
jgi:hypothetical protein